VIVVSTLDRLDEASRRRLSLFAFKVAIFAATAATPASLAGGSPTIALSLFIRLCALGAMIALALALLTRQRMERGSLGLWDESAAFGLLGSIAHLGLRCLAPV
jgi:hypothetical protein